MKSTKVDIKKHQKYDAEVPKKTDLGVQIMNVTINSTQKIQLLKKLWLQRKEMLHVATVNPEFVMEARTNAEFAKVLSNCTTVADGWGVVWALGLLSTSRVDRVTGTELTEEILKHAHEKGEKVFLLGASEGIAEKAAIIMSKKYPNAQITAYQGARRVQEELSEEGSVTIAKINSVEPDYLLVAYGSPWQDMWIELNRPYLRARVAMGIGGVLDEWAGVVTPCPKGIDQLGFKWLWRLTHEPWRWRRIMKVLQFAVLVVVARLRQGFDG